MNPSLVVLANLSETAKKTARYAALLGAPLHAHVALLHFYHDAGMLAPELAGVTAAQIDRNYEESAAEMQAFAQQLPGSAEVMVSAQSMTEAVAEAMHQQPLLLAMGLSPELDFLDELLRNRLLPVLRATHHPLLLVPETAPESALPRRVLLALDAEPLSLNEAGKKLAPLLAAWPATYTVAHIGQEPAAFLGRRLLANVRDSGLVPPDSPLCLYQEAGVAPADGILQALADSQADLLVLIARPRSFLGQLFHRSVTAQVLRRSPVPVLLVPAKAPALPPWMPTMS